MRYTVDFQHGVADLEEADGRTVDVELERADVVRCRMQCRGNEERRERRLAQRCSHERRPKSLLKQSAGTRDADASAYRLHANGVAGLRVLAACNTSADAAG